MFQVTRDGRILDEGIVRVNNARKEQKARSKGILANSIVNKAIELEVVFCKCHFSSIYIFLMCNIIPEEASR